MSSIILWLIHNYKKQRRNFFLLNINFDVKIDPNSESEIGITLLKLRVNETVQIFITGLGSLLGKDIEHKRLLKHMVDKNSSIALQ